MTSRDMRSGGYTIAGSRLQSVHVSAAKPRSGKTIAHGGLYFSTSPQGYPLELYLKLAPQTSGYHLVFVPDDMGEVWAGVFVGQARQSIHVPHELLPIHLHRYREMTDWEIAILGSGPQLEDMAGISLISIEKGPQLIDPDQTRKMMTRYGVAAAVFFVLAASLTTAKTRMQAEIDELLIAKAGLEGRKTAASARISGGLTPLPASDVLDDEIAGMSTDKSGRMPTIAGGRLSWQ